jgi:hypothetical protein
MEYSTTLPPSTQLMVPLSSGGVFFNDGEEEMSPFAMGAVNKLAVLGVNIASFPSNFGTVENRFTNQDEALNNESYDSKGNLPHFADKPNNNMEEYCEETIAGGGLGLWRQQRQWRHRWHQMRST